MSKMALLLLTLLALLIAAGCGQKKDLIPSPGLSGGSVKLDGVEPQISDDYAPLDARAHAGVSPDALAAALKGNPTVAREIGEAFARAQRISEARYWFQVSAENGDGISMQNLSVMLRDQDCLRANYWLIRALATSDIPSLARSSMEKDLEVYSKQCK